jgi:hypothetical protein
MCRKPTQKAGYAQKVVGRQRFAQPRRKSELNAHLLIHGLLRNIAVLFELAKTLPKIRQPYRGKTVGKPLELILNAMADARFPIEQGSIQIEQNSPDHCCHLMSPPGAAPWCCLRVNTVWK